MYKKKIFGCLCTSLMAFSALSAGHDADSEEGDTNYAGKYTGFDINVGVGYSGFDTDITATDSLTNVTRKENGVGASGVAVQARLGGTYGFYDYWLVGLDFYGQYNSAKDKLSITVPTVTRSASDTLEWNLGLDLRLGVVACPSNLFFVTVGPDWVYHHLKTNVTSSFGTFIVDDSKFIVGVRTGAGAEQKLSENWVIREQFGYSWYKKQSYYSQPTGTSFDVKNKLATMVFSIGYLF